MKDLRRILREDSTALTSLLVVVSTCVVAVSSVIDGNVPAALMSATAAFGAVSHICSRVELALLRDDIERRDFFARQRRDFYRNH